MSKGPSAQYVLGEVLRHGIQHSNLPTGQFVTPDGAKSFAQLGTVGLGALPDAKSRNLLKLGLNQ